VLTRAGEIGVGLFVLLAGRIEISRRDATGQSVPIIEHDPGQFVGEVAQLSGRPSLVNVKALTDVEVLQIAPDRLRAVLIAEAELGEKIMRALILRRVSLIETGAGGPVIIGRASDAEVIRLSGFLARNGHPFSGSTPTPSAAPRC
jgi:thioredoxin reductase (NADPH)